MEMVYGKAIMVHIMRASLSMGKKAERAKWCSKTAINMKATSEMMSSMGKVSTSLLAEIYMKGISSEINLRELEFLDPEEAMFIPAIL